MGQKACGILFSVDQEGLPSCLLPGGPKTSVQRRPGPLERSTADVGDCPFSLSSLSPQLFFEVAL